MGVSVFFTLSGYLITSLLLDEFDAVAPASSSAPSTRVAGSGCCRPACSCLVGIVLLRFAGAFSQVQHLRADLTAATLQVFNWTELSRAVRATPACTPRPPRSCRR